MSKETKTRSILKTISWRIWATMTTVTLVYLFTDKVGTALSIGTLEVFLKMLFYYLHERIWSSLSFGRRTVKPVVLWFTGLSGSGKTTLADAVYQKLLEQGIRAQRLDGDIMREFFPQTGFSKEERDNHIRRAGFLSKLLERNGVWVIASFISPYESVRQEVRADCETFVEVFVSTPLEECERRDVKGLYAKARAGEIKNFTGIDDPFEAPSNPELTLDTSRQSLDESKDAVMDYLNQAQLMP